MSNVTSLTLVAWHGLTSPVNPLLVLGLLLLGGLCGGRVCMRVLRVPPATAYVLMGLLLGPSVFKLVDRALLEEIRLFVDLAAGMIVFQLGRRIDLHWLLREKRLLMTGLLESLLTVSAMLAVLVWLGVAPLVAGLAAAIGLATSPAVVLMAVRDQQAQGQVTERALHLTAMHNVLASVLFAVCLSALHVGSAGWSGALLTPLLPLLGAVWLGLLAGGVMVLLGRRFDKREGRQWPLVFALVTLTLGLAQLWQLAPWVTLLACGLASRALDRRYVLVEPDVQPLGTVFYLLLFVALGVSLQPELLVQAWLPALALLLARGLSRMGCVLALARLNALGWRQGLALGVAIQPMSGLAMVMAYQANEVYPALGGPLLATLLSAWLLLAILAPLGTRWALRFSGDAQG